MYGKTRQSNLTSKIANIAEKNKTSPKNTGLTRCKKLEIRCVTMGTNPLKEMEQADNLKLKRGLWKENNKEIRAELDELKKVKYIDMPTTKRERHHLREMTLTNARLWFRYQCKIIDHIKGNKSSVYNNNMACRLCTSGENET